MECKCQISGMPLLLLSLRPGTKLGNVRFHQSVNLKRWKQHPDQIEFIPPDGKFTLASFQTDFATQKSLPVVVEAKNKLDGRFEVRIRNTGKKSVENLKILITIPQALKSVTVTEGNYIFRASKYTHMEEGILEWSVKKLDWTSPALVLTGFLAPLKKDANSTEESSSYSKLEHLDLQYKLQGSTLHNFKVESLKMLNHPDKKSYKGVKHTIIAQNVSFRFR